VLLDRPALELPPAVAGGHRQARRGLRGQPVRLRHLGRARDLVAVLRRHSAAAGELNRNNKESTMLHDNIGEQIPALPTEPLLPIEKKLIGWSLGIGIALLIVLTAISRFM